MRIVSTLYPQNTTQTFTNQSNERIINLMGPNFTVPLVVSVTVPSYRIKSFHFPNEGIFLTL